MSNSVYFGNTVEEHYLNLSKKYKF